MKKIETERLTMEIMSVREALRPRIMQGIP